MFKIVVQAAHFLEFFGVQDITFDFGIRGFKGRMRSIIESGGLLASGQ